MTGTLIRIGKAVGTYLVADIAYNGVKNVARKIKDKKENKNFMKNYETLRNGIGA